MSGWSIERVERAAKWFMIAVSLWALGLVIIGRMSWETASAIGYFASWPKIIATEYRRARQPKPPKGPSWLSRWRSRRTGD